MTRRSTAVRRAVALGLAALLLSLALVLPDRPADMNVATFARFPLELPVLLGLLVATSGSRPGSRALRVLIVAFLTAATLLKLADFALFETFSRPFNPVTDLFVFPAALNLLSGAFGPVAAVAVVAAGLLAVALLVWTLAWATSLWARPGGSTGWRRVGGVTAVTAALIVALDAAPVATAPRLPLDPPGSAATTKFALAHAGRARRALRDLATYRRAASSDPYIGATGLFDRLDGHDVHVLFIESYGRASIDNPLYAATHVPTLRAAADDLPRAGLAARSFWLTSPIAGGQSWLAHGTFAAGLKTPDHARYGAMLASRRRTIYHLAQQAGYRTAAIMPAITLPWPEGLRLGFDTILAATDLGYAGKPFNWVTMPDQYTLAAGPRLLPDDPRPDFLQIALISSHAPWVPIPEMVGWEEVGDGRIFDRWAEAGDPPSVVWKDRDRVRDQYRQAIDYSLRAAFASIARNSGPDAPLTIVLGDHPPVPWVSQVEDRDVPVHMIGPPEIMAIFDGWNMGEGLVPGPDAPVWPMEAFRDRFLDATRAQSMAEALP